MSRKIVDAFEYENYVSKENKQLVDKFLFQKEYENCTPATLKQYRDDMRIVLTYVCRHFDNKNLLTLKKDEIIQILMIHKKRGVSPNRLIRLLGTMRSALGTFEDMDQLEYFINVAAKVKTPQKYPIRPITFLTDEQVDWLIGKLLSEGRTLMAVYLKLTYISGKRRGEIYQVLKEGLAERYYTNQVIVKGQKKKTKIFYDQETQDLIRMYLQERGPDEIPQLFVKCFKNGKKQAIHPSTFNEWCDYFSELLSDREGIKIPINPHCFRHSRIENLDREGVPLKKISKYVNHKSVGTTEMYLAEREEDDAADILGLDVKDLGGQSKAVTVNKDTPKPIIVPMPVMVDKTDRKQPVLTKDKKKKYEQMALF